MTEQCGLQAGAPADPELASGPGQIQDLDVTGDDTDGIIVFGSRGGGGFARPLYRSPSTQIAQHAKVPESGLSLSVFILS